LEFQIEREGRMLLIIAVALFFVGTMIIEDSVILGLTFCVAGVLILVAGSVPKNNKK